MTWKVKYPGIITATIVRIIGDKSIKMDNKSKKADNKMSRMEGLRVVFYCTILS